MDHTGPIGWEYFQNTTIATEKPKTDPLPIQDGIAGRQARRYIAKVIPITNRLTSKLTQKSDFALCVTADDSPLGGEHGAARMVQLSIGRRAWQWLNEISRQPKRI